MAVDLSAVDRMMPKAVRHFWKARTRAGVTAGKNLDGFVTMARQIIVDNGIAGG